MVYDSSVQKLLREIDVSGVQLGVPNCLLMMGNGVNLVIGEEEGIVSIDVETAKLAELLIRNGENVCLSKFFGVNFMGQSVFASGQSDGVIKLWQDLNPEEKTKKILNCVGALTQAKHGLDEVTGIIMLPNSAILATYANSTIQMWEEVKG